MGRAKIRPSKAEPSTRPGGTYPAWAGASPSLHPGPSEADQIYALSPLDGTANSNSMDPATTTMAP